jgi:hypothetical protein
MKLRSFLLASLILSLIPLNSPAGAQSIDPCRIKASDWQPMSLGFPLRSERLANLSAPKILVIPFQLQDTPDYVFSSDLKQNYLAAANQINEFSRGKSMPQFIFSPVIKTEITGSDIRDLVSNQNIGNQTRDESISTWGFVRQFIAKYDTKLDFTGVSGVVLEGSYPGRGIAEAMSYIKNYDPYWRPLKTDEGDVLNAVLMDGHWGTSTIAHEVMHLYGLVDLYGSDSSPANTLMSDGANSLLALEKWTLGWLADENVQCISEIVDIKADAVNNAVSVDYSSKDQLIVIPTGLKTALFIDVTKRDTRGSLAFYSLDHDRRPSINAFSSNKKSPSIEVGYSGGIGSFIESPKYTLLIKDNIGFKLSLSLIPKDLANSDVAKKLFADAENTRISNAKLVQAENEAKAATELKAKQEAEANAIAEAKTAAELKAKQEAAVKAATKKNTIACVKGKLTKKVTGVKPKCPAGYKLKK